MPGSFGSTRSLRCSWLAGALIAPIVAATSLSATAGPITLHSPLADLDSVQTSLHVVVDVAAPSVFAVTAFNAAPTEPSLWTTQLRGHAFAAVLERTARNCGTAFAISERGELLTNEHVVSGAASVWVTDDAGRAWPAVVVGTDPRADLAILKIPTMTTPLALASAMPRRGDLSITLGNPDGIAAGGIMSASVGCVSAVGRTLPTLSAREGRAYGDLIQTTTPITAGSSGGPLLDGHGNAIGIVTAVAPADMDRDAIGFAISLNAAGTQKTIERLRRGEEVTYGYLGVSVADDVATLAQSDAAALTGARISAVEPDAPATGILRAGDLVVRFGDQPITSGDALIQLSAASPVDREVPITVRRAGIDIELKIRPTRRAQPAQPVTAQSQSLAWAGAIFRNAPGGGIAVERVSAGSPLVAGSVIRAIDGVPIANVSEALAQFHAKLGKPMKIELADADRNVDRVVANALADGCDAQ